MTHDTTLAILGLLAEGRTVASILREHPALTPQDVQAAAADALRILAAGETRADRIARVRARHANAFAPWTQKEDLQLRFEFEAGASVAALSRAFARPPGAIRMRLEKLGIDPRQRRRAAEPPPSAPKP